MAPAQGLAVAVALPVRAGRTETGHLSAFSAAWVAASNPTRDPCARRADRGSYEAVLGPDRPAVQAVSASARPGRERGSTFALPCQRASTDP